MNNLCADIGYKSIYHYGEELCGDHVDIVESYLARHAIDPSNVFHRMSSSDSIQRLLLHRLWIN